MKLLFITHDASRSGAPMVLLHLMRWLKTHRPKVVFDILFVKGGVMEHDFKALSNESFYMSSSIEENSLKKLIKKRLGKKIGLKGDRRTPNQILFEQLSLKGYSVIYSNTVVSIPYGHAVKNNNSKLSHVVHVHELPTIISSLLPNFEHYIPSIDRFIAVSHQVNTHLVTKWHIPQDRVEVVYECAEIKVNKQPKNTRVFTVGASGYSYWRKGNDVFLQVARYVKKQYPLLGIEFVWVGNESSDKSIIDADIEKMGLKDAVKFVGEVVDPSFYFNAFDVFLLTSREDPFPLVCIEVALLEKPIICFEQASGTAEVVKQGGGFVVPYLDIEAMAEKIVYYYHHSEELEQHGKRAFQLFKDFTPETICPKLFNVIEKEIN